MALRVGVAVILSQRPTPGTVEYSTNRFCWETYILVGVLKSQIFKLCFGALRSRQKIGKVTKRRRSVKPTCADGGTNRANGGTNASFCTSGEFQNFLARGQICFEFDSATLKREKKKERRKKDCGQRQREEISLIFLQGFIFGEGNRWLFTPGAKNFSCSRRRCSCVVRFACAWLNGQLGFERLSNSCTMSGGKWPSLSIQALRDDAAGLSVRSTETVRSMPLVVQLSLLFTLEELYEEPATEAGRALGWPFFLVWEQFLSVEVIEEERKASKRQSSSVR